MNLQDTFIAAWTSLTGAPPDSDLVKKLLAAYADPARAYHSTQHLAECLIYAEQFRLDAENYNEIIVALWFHDAVYDPRRSDNESRSAEWACLAWPRTGATTASIQRIAALILATKHDTVLSTPDARLLADIDLSILGAKPARFDEYERQVRTEYAWVPDSEFRLARAKILRAFLERPSLYSTKGFRNRFESPARQNLARSLSRLES